MVYVVNRHGKPLMPTKRHDRVRILLKSGMAVPICNNPFTIKLKYDTGDYVQDLWLGVDPGRENIGIGVSRGNGECVFLSELRTCNKSIRKNMDSRRQYRRARRRNRRLRKQRKALRDGTVFRTGEESLLRNKKPCMARTVSYPGMDDGISCKAIRGAEAQYVDRKRKEGWQTPSGRQLIQMHFHAVEAVMAILPVSHIVMERNVFDFQKLEDADIRAWEYSRGPLYGYGGYKEYIHALQDGKCLLCGGKIDCYHHIKPLGKGGSDTVRNIAGLCDTCHNSVDGVHKDEETGKRLSELKEGLFRKYRVSLLNSVMPELVRQMDAFCSRKGISFSLIDGKGTAECREKHGIPKGHGTDGYAISLAGRDLGNCVLTDTVYIQQRFKKKSAANISKLNQREYFAVKDGKRVLIARNRHKAEGQITDSLEEYMEKYAGSHIYVECMEYLKSLAVKPAKRTYFSHRYGKWCSIHAGDVVLYEKHNKVKGNIKHMVFVATNVKTAAGYIEFGSRSRKANYCRTLRSLCTPFVDKVVI